MIKVKIMFAHKVKERTLAYISYLCTECGKHIVSFRTLHKCYNCKAYVVSGGLLVNSPQYRFDYHMGRVGDDGNIYEGGVNSGT